MALKARELYDFLTDQGFQPDLVEDDEELVISCPLCEDDRQRLYINAETGAWHCFHCSEEGNLHRLFLAVCGLNGSDAFELRRQVWTDDDDYEDTFERRKKSETISDVVLRLPPQFTPIDRSTPELFLRYLKRRHVSPELAAARGIGYAEYGRYGYRIIVPVENDKHLYTFIGRTVLVQCPNCTEEIDACTCSPYRFPKVLTPTKKHGSQPKLSLYNLDAVRASNSARLVVVEGVFDALRLPNEAVATLGASASATQITLIAGLARGRKCIVAYDGDQAGYLGSIKVASALMAGTMADPVRVALLPSGKDPGSLPRAELEKALKSARRFRL